MYKKIEIMGMTNSDKAKLYDSLINEHSRKAAMVRELEVEIRPTAKQQEQIVTLKKEMNELEKKATSLVMAGWLCNKLLLHL